MDDILLDRAADRKADAEIALAQAAPTPAQVVPIPTASTSVASVPKAEPARDVVVIDESTPALQLEEVTKPNTATGAWPCPSLLQACPTAN